MATTGEIFPASGTSTSESPWSDNSWTNPAQAISNNSTYASVTSTTFDNGDQTHVLKVFGFDFSSIPVGSSIDGVTARIESRADTTSVGIDLVQLLNVSRAKVGTNQSDTSHRLTTSDTVYTFGGPTSTWGNALTLAWVQDADFGVAVGGRAYTNNSQIFVDYVTLEIAYTPPVTTHEGSTSGTVGWAGAVTGTAEHGGGVSGAVSWTGTVTGEAPLVTIPEGSATGSVTWSGTVTGASDRSGDATGSLLWDGTVSGGTIHQGVTTGSYGWSGSTTGFTVHDGSTVGVLSWIGSVQGTAPTVGIQEGTADGSLAWAGSVTGTAHHEGTAVGTLEWAGTADGTTTYQGSATGVVDWVGSASSEVQPPPRYRLEAHRFDYGWMGG